MSLKDIWDSLFKNNESFPTNLTQARRGGAFEVSQDTGHELDVDKIEALRSKQSKGYKVIDIDPNQLDKEGFSGAYNDDVLSRLIGNPNNGYGINTRIDNEGPAQPYGTPRPYQRTLQFDVPGNFLKIEFLPARSNLAVAPNNQALANDTNIIPQNTNQTQNGGQFYGMGDAAGRRSILVDFEEISAAPHLAPHGRIFNTYFSSFFITVYQLNVRIRITVGLNSTILDRTNKETNLALWGGQGITNDSPVNPVPFCLTSADIGNPKHGYGIVYNTLPNVDNFFNLIFSAHRDQTGFGGQGTNTDGLGILFITGFRASMMSLVQTTYVDTASKAYGIVELLQMGFDTSDPACAPTNIIKKFTSVSVLGTISLAKFSDGTPAEANFKEAIRVTLRPGECLALRVTVLSGTGANSIATYLQFSLEGYCFGNLIERVIESTAYGCYRLSRAYTEHPWPQDVDTSFPNY